MEKEDKKRPQVDAEHESVSKRVRKGDDTMGEDTETSTDGDNDIELAVVERVVAAQIRHGEVRGGQRGEQLIHAESPTGLPKISCEVEGFARHVQPLPQSWIVQVSVCEE